MYSSKQLLHYSVISFQILPADCLTRVSEYIPENISFIEKIIERGFAYESNGSVYFSVSKFDTSKDHHYAKLVPEAFGDQVHARCAPINGHVKYLNTVGI